MPGRAGRTFGRIGLAAMNRREHTPHSMLIRSFVRMYVFYSSHSFVHMLALMRRTLDLPPAGGFVLEDGIENLVDLSRTIPTQRCFEDFRWDPSKPGLVLEPDGSVRPNPHEPQIAVDVDRDICDRFPDGRKDRVGDEALVVQSKVREFDGSPHRLGGGSCCFGLQPLRFQLWKDFHDVLSGPGKPVLGPDLDGLVGSREIPIVDRKGFESGHDAVLLLLLFGNGAKLMEIGDGLLELLWFSQFIQI